MIHERKMIIFKSEILEILNDNIFTFDSSGKWFDELSIVLSDFFEVDLITYFVFDTNLFLKTEWNESNLQKQKPIKWLDIEPYFHEKDYAVIPHLQENDFANGEVFLLFRDSDGLPLGMLKMESSDKWKEFSQTDDVSVIYSVMSKLIQTINKSIILTQQEKQYRNLFKVTEMFNSSLDLNHILEGTLEAMQKELPDFETILILANDQDRKPSVPFKLFDYTSERQTTVEAYVSGEFTIDIDKDLNIQLFNIPIKGKQGIYGIVQVAAPIDYLFSARQKEFSLLLTSATGNALENAKLYIQSHRLVTDLQLINETSHKLNSNLSLDDMLVFLKNQLIKSFQPEQTCFVMKIKNEYEIAPASTEFFHTDEGQVYIKYVANYFERMKDTLFMADLNRISELKKEYRSMIAIPLKEQNEIVGFSIVLHKEPYFFSFDSFKLMQSLIQHSSLAISNSTLRNKLQEMVNRDHLTNLFARKYLDKYVENSMEKDQSGVFILLDIDNFKNVNDTYGHQIGDEILKKISSIITRMVDGIGIGARWGGEEMALYLPNTTKLIGIDLAKELIDSIPKETNPSVTVSVGLCEWGEKCTIDFKKLFHYADTALYSSKNNGKNQLQVFEVFPS